MHESDIPELDARGLRRFALTTGAIVIGLFALMLPLLFGWKYPLWPWVFGGLLATWGLVAPASLRGVYWGWMRFGLALNKITTPIVLGLIFYLVFSPVALVMRIVGRDTMARHIDPAQASYRVRSTNKSKESFRNPY